MCVLLSFATPLISLVLAACPVASDAGIVRDALGTNFAMLVGYPSPEQSAPGGTPLVPGTIIPLEAEPGSAGSLRSQIIEKSLSFTQAAEKLWTTFRLDPSRRRQMGKYQVLAAGDSTELPPIGDAGVRLNATLVQFNDQTATFRIQFLQGEKSLVDSTVPVARGGRAVVGGMDGAAAPYIFLLVEPAVSGEKLSDAGTSRPAGVTLPEILTKIAPDYPVEAKEDKVAGMVILQFTVEKDGKISGIRALQDPDSRLTAAAIDALRQWRFQPARDKDGKPVDVLTTVTFNFQLK
jgi:TonB family protein